MADQTIVGNKLMETAILSGEKDVIANYTEIYTINGVDIIACHLVGNVGETSPDIDLLSGGEPLVGIPYNYASESDKKASYSLGVTMGDDKKVKVLRRTGGRVKIQVLIRRTATVSAAIAKGQPIYASFTTPGLVSSVKPTTANIAPMRFVGYAAEDVAVTVTAHKVITVYY